MEWTEYKMRCDAPEVMSRWMIEQSATLLDGPDREALLGFLDDEPLRKPADHNGGAATDMFVVGLRAEHAARILSRMEAAAEAGVATAAGRSLRGFVAAWREHTQALGHSTCSNAS